jgi:hypothetical protein
LIIAHRDELIRQAADKLQAITCDRVSIEVGRERAEHKLFRTKVTVGSVQSLARSKRRTGPTPGQLDFDSKSGRGNPTASPSRRPTPSVALQCSRQHHSSSGK